jgi:myo-inositol 2-dehydrogenase/D-chiro-inositol 1-dehydrogenase
MLLRHLIDDGKLGRIFHYRAKFLQDWTISEDLPQGGEGLWRLDVAVAGSGVTGDLLAHCIDTAMWLNGPIDGVTAMTETFVKSRKHNLTGRVEPVGIDDACAFLSRFRNGSLATFESTRYARGHKALYTLEINGEHASAAWDLHDLHRLQWFDHRDQGQTRGWRSIHVTDGDHPYMKHWWVPGLQIGYEHTFIHQFADFCTAAAKGESAPPSFRDGLATDQVTDAVLKSARTAQWEQVGAAPCGPACAAACWRSPRCAGSRTSRCATTARSVGTCPGCGTRCARPSRGWPTCASTASAPTRGAATTACCTATARWSSRPTPTATAEPTA